MVRLVLISAVAALAFAGPAQAQSETDRLREALRSATAQTRMLEDQRTQLQARLAEADRARTALQGQVDQLKGQLKEVEVAHRTAVETFNQKLEERNEVLERWKSAYAEAATVARTKDAERAKFEGESNACKVRAKSCEGKNKELVKIGQELMRAYEGVTIGDIVGGREPMFGLRRVDVQNLLQDYGGKIREQKVAP
ncbi:hypothetical protein PQJ75_24820 [Rhodoplanes sp. TEM]|uniref:DNA repair protein n=1 Tax=Rhodoplanes tepidamans TaxID=200616 RepID=A0ABT5JCN3_RHOTP|nr:MULTISPECIES: hypothetical protein [Rhodoplanes]MDC7787024.1 hypothetical protein [Rhodoplanes tepidamans]MDC7986966.1 hypothetical protein [Rhodoplanes sp. TEM]MDQ0354251.1 chromosome segregation ATPase [Rhodoplanes tepidamans]